MALGEGRNDYVVTTNRTWMTPGAPFDWDEKRTSCLGGHIIDMSRGEKPVEYLDGAIVGYCKQCRCRVTFPKVEGGLSVEWVNALATQLLGGAFDADLWADFIAAAQSLEKDLQAIDSALALISTVREVIEYRLCNE